MRSVNSPVISIVKFNVVSTSSHYAYQGENARNWPTAPPCILMDFLDTEIAVKFEDQSKRKMHISYSFRFGELLKLNILITFIVFKGIRTKIVIVFISNDFSFWNIIIVTIR